MGDQDNGGNGGDSTIWDACYVQAKEFLLERCSSGSLRAKTSQTEWFNTPDALWVLDQFTSPRSPREVAQCSSQRHVSALAWVDTMETIRGLIQAGVLVKEGTASAIQEPAGFAMASQHIAMLNDKARTSAFLQSIRALVKPEDVVVDIGTGTGVLALAAGLAGARQVYAIEMSAMADVAAVGVKANQLDERVKIIQEKSTVVSLPERATIVVGEIIGDDLFDESILPIFADAAKRLATSDAVFIPNALQPILQPIQLPPNRLGNWVYLPEECQRWTNDYGIDFQWLEHMHSHSGLVRHEIRAPRIAKFVCGPEILLPQITFPNQTYTYSEKVQWPGIPGANAFLLGFRADLGFGHSVSNIAGSNTEKGHWGTVLFVSAPGSGPDLSQPLQMSVEWQSDKTQIQVYEEQA